MTIAPWPYPGRSAVLGELRPAISHGEAATTGNGKPLLPAQMATTPRRATRGGGGVQRAARVVSLESDWHQSPTDQQCPFINQSLYKQSDVACQLGAYAVPRKGVGGMAAGDHGALETGVQKATIKRPHLLSSSSEIPRVRKQGQVLRRVWPYCTSKSGAVSSSHDIRYGMALHQPHAERLTVVHPPPPWLRV
ncbi:uncharacterized protein LY79DRAFT_261046 [Colletotrichum navitas]|uniref:Uncharacterized protein n=1 Tax=Colletotrichum navitas TaxID=681940 RepID=A0AAD8PW69_9PEZI|nr:uncharacterized protein LY79DRAFT_261046 [Colletotrichum navitas]KAK1585812.1 hypothetical protein LY79DRAFT_261046 [Colletotrichum navitas]